MFELNIHNRKLLILILNRWQKVPSVLQKFYNFHLDIDYVILILRERVKMDKSKNAYSLMEYKRRWYMWNKDL